MSNVRKGRVVIGGGCAHQLGDGRVESGTMSFVDVDTRILEPRWLLDGCYGGVLQAQ